ncbi:MAG TPA: efflux RND transporter periplasmic adaptor subunit [Pyrinomonadaceae bacterium]|jgi:HlyD family secretion protein|nr:efflux RND transporter periplasmic adaptor subunit [Pyrinomonadaceae bacterium]
MSSQTIKEHLPISGVRTEKATSWISQSWKKLLSRKKQLLLGGGGLAVLALAGFYFWGNQSSAPQYMTAKVERGNLRNTVTATGALQAVITVQVGSQASGTISALNVDFNDIVKQGQIIAQLDPSVPKAQVDQARANLQQARASLQQSIATVAGSRAGVSDAQAKAQAASSTVQNNQAGVSSAQANVDVLKAQLDDALAFLRQQESLMKSGVIAQRDYDLANTAYKTAEARYNQSAAQLNQAVLSQQSSAGSGIAQSKAQLQQSQAQVQQSQAQVQQAQAQVQQAEAALRLAEVNLAHTTITSPIDGIVVSRDVNVGQTVAASLSAPTLFTIAKDLTQMQVIANIDQADIGLVEQAKSVKFSVDAFPGKEYDGKIEQMRLNPVNVQNVVTYNVVIDVNNPEQKLKPGMTANLTITIDERNNVLKVPNSALRFVPTDASGQRLGRSGDTAGSGGQGQSQRRQRAQGDNANGADGATPQTASGDQQSGQSNFAPPTAPVLPGQTRMIWVMGQDGKLQSRRIKVGLSDGAATEVVEGNLVEGELVVTGQTITGATRTQNTNAAPGFGGAPRTGAPGGGRRN